MFSRSRHFVLPKGFIKQIFKHLPGSVCIGIGQGWFVRYVFHSQMFQFPHAAGQFAADLPEALGLCELAEEHGNEMFPWIKLFSEPFRLITIYKFMKFFPVDQSNKLTEQARMFYHWASSLFSWYCVFCGEATIPTRRIFFQPIVNSYIKSVFGQEWSQLLIWERYSITHCRPLRIVTCKNLKFFWILTESANLFFQRYWQQSITHSMHTVYSF